MKDKDVLSNDAPKVSYDRLVEVVDNNADVLIKVGRGLTIACVAIGVLYGVSKVRQKKLERRIDILESKLENKENKDTGE